MLSGYSPIYDLGSNAVTPIFFTLDGRFGIICKLNSYEELFTRYCECIDAYPWMHLQALFIDNAYYLTASEYIETSRDNIFAVLSLPRKEKLEKSAESVISQLLEIGRSSGEMLTEYPIVPDISSRHLYKLKYHLTREALSELKYYDGLALIHFPGTTDSVVMYLTTRSLREMLLDGVLCIEFVEQFKNSAYMFWLPLGSAKYFSQLFKL